MKLTNLGKYQLNMRQMQTLEDMGLDDELLLDLMDPIEFKRIPYFGDAYVDYVAGLRGSNAKSTINLLEEDADDFVMPPYKRIPDSFHPLESGRVDVRLTINLNPSQARWLESLMHRLPELYPNDPSKHDLGWALQPYILDAMKNVDGDRHGSLPGGSGLGTVNKSQLEAMKGLGRGGH